MACTDKQTIELILQLNRRTEHNAVKCLKKCEKSTNQVLNKMGLQEPKERFSVFNLALAEFIIQVRTGRFILTGEAKICTYITEIAKRKWLAILKKKKPIDSGTNLLVETKEQNYNEHLHQALKRLNPEDQEILVAFYFYNMSLDDFATRNNLSHAAAKKRISRARQKLLHFL